jgi:uncharacterized protein YkwD
MLTGNVKTVRAMTIRNTRLMLHRIFQIALLNILAIAITPAASQQSMLALHNQVRKQAGVPPLVWSDPLAAHAQEWADKLIARNAFEHSHDSHYGENLFEIEGARATPQQVIDSWASEARGYDYRINRCRGVCGHYTQLVWRDTKEVGCAVASRGNREVWVCNYNPPGNYVGERPY